MNALQKAELDLQLLVVDIDQIEAKAFSHGTKALSVAAVAFQHEKTLKNRDSLLEINQRILNACAEDKRADYMKAYGDHIKRLDSFTEFFAEIQRKHAASTASSTSTPATPAQPPPSAQPKIKIPEMKIPQFDGKYENWPEFEDLFTAVIDKNASLSPAQKLQYLKGNVLGDASNLIKAFIIIDSNYKEAWDLLKATYDNKREIIYQLCKRLLYQQHSKTENAAALQSLLNTTTECVRSLKSLGQDVDKWDSMIVVSLAERFDTTTKTKWAESLTSTSPTTLSEMIAFIQTRIRGLHAKGASSSSAASSSSSSSSQQFSNRSRQKSSSHQHNKQIKVHAATTQQHNCPICQENHPLYKCGKLLAMDPSQRNQAVRKTNLCMNCFRRNHTAEQCNSPHSCKTCGKKHNTILHPSSSSSTSDNNSTKTVSLNQVTVQASKPAVFTLSAATSSSNDVLLKTASVHVMDSFGTKQTCRLLLDERSQGSFITEKRRAALGLVKRKTKANVIIKGVSNSTTMAVKWETTFSIYSRHHNSFITIEAFILPRQVTGNLPQKEIDTTHFHHLQDLELADPNYFMPGEIDILVGSDVVPYLITQGYRSDNTSSPVAQNTIFGWVISGKATTEQTTQLYANLACCDLENLVHRFWEIETLPNKRQLTKEEEECEQHFKETTIRKPDGSYEVKLPFNSKKDSIGSTREQALRQFYALEKRFKRYPEKRQQYIEFMREYISLQHMSEATQLLENELCSYIPHHFVIKEESTTTKLRVVFNASMKSSTGVSLNDTLKAGPTIQDDLLTQIIRFRTYAIALKSDLAKMFRKFGVSVTDRNMQRIFWRENETEPVKEYVLNTVTYGTKPATFQAVRCLQQLAEDEKELFPIATHFLLYNMYVDDLLAGCKTVEEAIALVKDMIALCKTAGLEIRKWCSNSEEVINSIPLELREHNTIHDFVNTDSVKTLGIRGNPSGDFFYFIFNHEDNPEVITKSTVLSEIAKCYDPVGWLTPVTITAKILFQELWREGIDWDTPISEKIKNLWLQYKQDLHHITQIKLPRCIVPATAVTQHIYGFSDASEKAMAAVVYLKVVCSDGQQLVHLVTSRTKIAPLQQTSLPRLELQATLLLAETLEAVTKSFNFPYTLHTYTDSMITYHWLTSTTRRWKTFVANRVSAVKEIIPSSCWKHVISEDNPADLPSRGIPASELVDNTFWWNGPEWILSNPDTTHFPEMCCQTKEEICKEERNVLHVNAFHITTATKEFNEDLLTKLNSISSLSKVMSTVGWLLRFKQYLISKARKQQHNTIPYLTARERATALVSVLKMVQHHKFAADIKHLIKTQADDHGASVHHSSKLRPLNPFIDKDGVLRVGGRIQRSTVNYDQRHPIILPHDHSIVIRLIEFHHEMHLHAGFTLTLSLLRRKYWIAIHGRSLIRNTISKCVACRIVKAAKLEQQMGILPLARVTQQRPFIHCGVDFAGPFYVKMRRGRGAPNDKCYMAVFICLSTKACHLDAVTSLSTADFIACYHRFVARRGIPSDMYSDSGTNFVGTDNELQRMLKQFNQSIGSQLSTHGTTWHFNRSAPHQGGLWEAAVKSAKFHLKRVVSNTTPTLEQFQTLLCNVEACLNSRPISPLSADPLDFNALTPGHFLIGEPLVSVPEGDYTTLPSNRLDHWQHVQQMSQHWWKRWRAEYVSELQQRRKWNRQRRNLEVHDLVLMCDEVLPPTKWKLARVIATHPGEDGLVRTATVRTFDGYSDDYTDYKRPVQKLSLIMANNEDLTE